VTQEPAIEALFVVKSDLGLHARPAGRFVALAGRFDCDVQVGRGNDWVSGKSVLSLLSLAAGPGTELRIRAVGPGAEEAVEALGRLLEEPEAQGP
jgi:phosphocarrier protein